MDYLELARKALELRQFLEADTYIKKINDEALLGSRDFLELKFLVSKNLKTSDYHQAQENLLSFLKSKQDYQRINELCLAHLESGQKIFSYIYQYQVESLYSLGQISKAALQAKLHIEFLLKNKLYQKWELEVEKYEMYFKNYIFFKLMALQLFIIQEDEKKALEKWRSIVRCIDERFAKLEDVRELSKSEILKRSYEMINQMDGSTSEIAMLSNQALLYTFRNDQNPLEPHEWKKLVELIVHDRSWFNLKLCLNISMKRDSKIFDETIKYMKNLKGFNLIKLTRFDSELKKRVLVKRDQYTSSENPSLSMDDLVLDEPIQTDRNRYKIKIEDEEIADVEENFIRRFYFEEIAGESYVDLITTFIQLNFYKVASFLIERAEEKELLGKEMRKVKYLKITVSMEQGEFYLALAELSMLLGSKEIELDEYIELRYLEGCLYEKVGDTVNALVSFREVERNSSEYRRLKERIQGLA